jgi:hypothetical protein
MNFASFQQDSPQVGYALLRKQHLIVGLDHISSNSRISLATALSGVYHME